MLPSYKRIKDKELIGLILKTGRVIKTSLFNVYFKNIDKPSQFVVIVSKKVSKKAVERNQLKRRLINIFKEFEQEINPTTKIVIVLKKEIISADKNDIKEEFKKALKK